MAFWCKFWSFFRRAATRSLRAFNPSLAFGFAVLLMAGALFALEEYDYDQAVREPWLYRVLASLMATWILVEARTWIGWAWARTLVALGYTVVRSAVAA